MPQTVLKLYAAATGDAAAAIDLPDGGVIEALHFAAEVNSVADNDGFRSEVSFASTSGFVSNDTRASIGGIRGVTNFTTSGSYLGAINVHIPMEVAVQPGERLYLHNSWVGAGIISVWVYLRQGVNAPRARFRTV